MEQWWICPKCGNMINFNGEMYNLFDYHNGEAMFTPKHGVMFHTIMCDCGAYWVMSLSQMYDSEQEILN